MAEHGLIGGMVSQRDIASVAFQDEAALMAKEDWGMASSIEEEDNLLFFLEALEDFLLEDGANGSGLILHIDDGDDGFLE